MSDTQATMTSSTQRLKIALKIAPMAFMASAAPPASRLRPPHRPERGA